MRELLLTIVFSMAVGAAHAQSAQVAGAAGYLSEWAFSGNLSWTGAPGGNEFSGSVIWKHVGLCSHDGPEQKLEKITLQIFRSGPAPQIQAVLGLDGAQCKYTGPLSKNATGRMDCSDAKGVPLTLSIDIR